MSKTIREEKHFLGLLINTSKDQARALLYTVTPNQVLAISEIDHNLLILPLPPTLKVIIERRRKVLQKLANKSISVRAKTYLVKNT